MKQEKALQMIDKMIDMQIRINQSYRCIDPEKVGKAIARYEDLRVYVTDNLKRSRSERIDDVHNAIWTEDNCVIDMKSGKAFPEAFFRMGWMSSDNPPILHRI